MQFFHIEASFEIRKVEAREMPLPTPLNGPSSLVLLDRKHRWFVDPLLMGVEHVTAVKKASEDKQPIYEMDGQIFVDLEWLSSKPLKLYRRLPSAIPADQLAETFIMLAEALPSQTVAVKMIREVPGVISYH